MKKSTVAITLLASLLLISSGIFAIMALDSYPLAKTEYGRNNLEQLMAEMGVSPHPFNNDPLEAKLLSPAGNSVGLGDLRGKIVFLNFWTTWCPTCITEMPSMERLHQKLSGKDFAMVTVNIKETASQVKDFFEKQKLTFTALMDITGEVSTEFGIRAIPTTFILDKNGQILGRIAGPREWDSKEALAMFENLADN